MADATREQALDDVQVVAEPVASGTAPESLTAATRKRPALDLGQLLDTAADEIERLQRRAANAEDTVMLSPQARGGLDGLKIVCKVLRGHEPLIGVVLWVTRDHVASFRRACD